MKIRTLGFLLILPFLAATASSVDLTTHEKFQGAISYGKIEDAKKFYQPGFENKPLTSRIINGRAYGAGPTYAGRSPLYFATLYGKSEAVVEFLLEKGALFSEVDPQHTHGRSVVFLCSQWPQRLEWATFLMQKGLGTDDQFQRGLAVSLQKQQKEKELAAWMAEMRKAWSNHGTSSSRKCHRCGGSGGIGTATSYTNCPECNGSGRR